MIIAGAGPVGVTAALLLAQWGVPTVALEAKAGPDRIGSKAICTQRDVLDIFERIGCGAAMVAEGVTWSLGRTYFRQHELFRTEFPDAGEGGLPPWINLAQSRTEAHLLDRLAGEPLARLLYGRRVAGVRDTGDGVEVDVEVDVKGESGPGSDGGSDARSDGCSDARSDGGSDGATAGGERVVVRGSHLIAADGSRSTVRRLLGVEFEGRSFDDQFLIVDIRADLPFPKERRFYFDPPWNPGRQVLVHEQPGRVYRIDWQVPPDYDLEAEQQNGALDARIRRITGDLPYEIVWLSVYRFHERCASSFRRGRVFLAGDAAHLVAPFGARGLNSGVQDADNLAWKLAFARRGWGDAEVLARSYEIERRAAALENVRVTSATMEFLVPQTDAERASRQEVLERAVGDPSARRFIDSGKLAEPYWYLDSPLTTGGGPPDDFPSEPGGRRPPVAGVLCPDGPCVAAGRPEVRRLRQLFGRSIVVLVAGGPDAARRAAGAAQAAVPGAPVDTYSLTGIDRDRRLAPALAAGRDSVHVVRPDGHLAAVLPSYDGAALQAALRRVCGLAPIK